MKKIRKGIAAIIWTKIKGKKKYLIFRRKKYRVGWEWLKGGCKKGEKRLDCLKRELKEEAGKKVEEYIIRRTNLVHCFMYQKLFVHDRTLWNGARNQIYVVEFNNSKVGIDKTEHSGFRWVTKKDAIRMLTWPDTKEIFRKIN